MRVGLAIDKEVHRLDLSQRIPKNRHNALMVISRAAEVGLARHNMSACICGSYGQQFYSAMIGTAVPFRHDRSK